jgi:Putative phage tail protein
MPGSVVATYLFTAAASGTWYYIATAFAVNMIASSIISKSLGSQGPSTNDATQNPGSRAQIPPAGDNKVPVVYGSAYVGGIITDLSITSDNQKMFYVMTLAEVTNTETGGYPDTYTFGNVYWGGKKCVFGTGADTYKVVGLLDESTGVTDTTVAGKMNIYLYNNGSSSGINTSLTAIQVMQSSGLVYTWDGTKLMTNAAFAIIELTYNNEANITGIQQTKFQLTNSRYKTGDCFSDYWQSTRYGAGLPLSEIDTTSLTELNTYGDGAFTYTTSGGGSATQDRFRFDGTLDTNNTIMVNMQSMASCCDCLIKYNEITGQWGVIVQKPTYTVVMDINDSNMVSAIQVSPIDLASSYNIAEVKFPDSSAQDAFNTSTFDLAEIAPSLLYPNEPINKQTISLPLVNNSVRAQYLANRFLEAAREDLQIKVDVNFSGIQLEAGDILTVTNSNYGWTAKPFRISQIVEKFGDDGQITASLSLMEFNPQVYDDKNITQFTPAPNTGIGSPLGFGILYAPTVTNIQTSSPIPSFDVAVTAASNGIVQYAEVYYSAYASPTLSQRFFAGTTAVNPGGNPYDPGSSMGVVTLSNIPQGDWYFAVRYVNSLGSSDFSASSSVLQWRPLTFQFTERWLAVAYADNATGTSGFSYDPRGKAYFGIFNNDTANGGTDPTLYTWYSVAAFGTSNYLLYANRQNRKFSFDVGNAGYINLGGAFVPTQTSVYDSTQWSALLDPVSGVQSFIDLDVRTGQLTIAGATGNNVNDGFLAVTNNTDGSMKVNLHDFLNFGAGVYSKSFSAATLTVDVYGRVVGFSEADNFYYTEQPFIATAGQTSFSFTHTVGWILVFRNGDLLDPTEYTETGTTVVMNTACVVGETVVIIYMRGNSTSAYYEPLNITIASSGTNTVTYSGLPWNQVQAGDSLGFSNVGTPLTYVVASVNQSTKVITFTTPIVGATAGLDLYRYRAAGADYAPFTRYDQDVTAITSFLPTEYEVRNGFEYLFVNGVQISEIDYDVNPTTNAIGGFPAPLTGRLSVIQFTPNNLAVPASNIANTPTYSVSGQSTYPFNSNPLSMEVYANGCLLTKGSGYDYNAYAASWVLTTPFGNNDTLLNQQTFARMGAA